MITITITTITIITITIIINDYYYFLRGPAAERAPCGAERRQQGQHICVYIYIYIYIYVYIYIYIYIVMYVGLPVGPNVISKDNGRSS